MPTSSRNISLRELRTFCIVAEHESFREAAERLFVTASAVSHQIKHLEDEFAARLFSRTSRTTQLTEAGRALYEDLLPVIERLDEVVKSHGFAARRTVLKISVQPFFASELLIPRLSQFTALHPELHIKVDTSDESSEKHPEDVDLSIRIFSTPPGNLNAERLFPLRLVPAGSPEFLDNLVVRKNGIVSDFPLIVHETRPKAWAQWAQSAGMTLPKRTNVVRLDSMIAVARAAERGVGAALVPIQLSDSWFESRSLLKLFEHELVTDDAYYVVCSEAAIHDEDIRLFREWVLQIFGDCG